MLNVNGLYKYIDKKTILNNITLTVNSGEIVGLVGSNGCGKSTLLNCITTVYNSEKGFSTFNNEIIKDNIMILENIYYVQDDLYFKGRSSLLDVFNFEKEFYPNASKDTLLKYTELFNIDPKKSLNTLSKGQKKQAAFILAISANTNVILLDELIDGVDALVKKKIWNVILDEVYQTDRMIFMTSHDLKEIERFCERVYLMDEGQIVNEISMAYISDEYKHIQFATKEEFDISLLETDNIINHEKVGSVNRVIFKGNIEELKNSIEEKHTLLLLDELDITLEDVFVSELGGK